LSCLSSSQFANVGQALGLRRPPRPPARSRLIALLQAALVLCLAAAGLLRSQTQSQAGIPQLSVSVNKSLIVDNSSGIKRVSVSNGDLAEAVAVSTTEIVLNGKAPGETSLVVWDGNGQRTLYDVHILPNNSKIEYVRQALKSEFPGQDISVSFDEGSVLLRGTAKDVTSADRALAIASILGKVVSLLHVAVPPSEPQILLKVKFANVDRTASSNLGANFFSTGAGNNAGSISTGQFGGLPTFDFTQKPYASTVPNPLNLFLWRSSARHWARSTPTRRTVTPTSGTC
jgi:pilus assembly protein CpaC